MVFEKTKGCIKAPLTVLLTVCALVGCNETTPAGDGGEGVPDADGADGGSDAAADADADGDVDGDGDADADGDGDGDTDADVETDDDADIDAADADDEPLGELTCEEDGTATVCSDEDDCVTIGPCVLGCDEDSEACYVPSNVPADSMVDGTEELGDLALAEVGVDVVINTDTGSITAWSGDVRGAVIGRDDVTGTIFEHIEQTPGSEVGVLTLHDFSIPAGVTAHVTGGRPLVILATGSVSVDGAIDVGGRGSTSGPGGFIGGEPGAPGEGLCGGQNGNLELACSPFCATGGGGGGHGGTGGDGGEVLWVVGEESGTLAGGEGGDRCGTINLVPLIGGSGGAGGTLSEEPRPERPGPGGGGGGAIQISAAEVISFGAGGGLTAPGAGGGTTLRGGGAGGGAGGGILLEAPRISLDPLASLAANGGGGGGGDCT